MQPARFRAIFLLAALGTLAAQAQTFTVLHAFTASDGAFPSAALIADPAGDLFGCTPNGGTHDGTVFRLRGASLTTLHNFSAGMTGKVPEGVIRDSAGNLYGATESGGAHGYGTVFKIDKTGLTVLHAFKAGRDGGHPLSGVIQDAAGNLYGTTNIGGPAHDGTVYKVDESGAETVLYSFAGGADGVGPDAGLLLDSAGNLYGTAGGGASDQGVVYRLDPTGAETVLYTFTGGADGGQPEASLIMDSAGNLYSTTASGGTYGQGVVFKLDTAGTETVLYSFAGGADGAAPMAGLVLDPAGNLYGTTYAGGAFGRGVVFKLDAAGVETVLHTFTNGADGAQPVAGLLRDSAGNLYGSTEFGGATAACGGGGCGVLFKIAP